MTTRNNKRRLLLLVAVIASGAAIALPFTHGRRNSTTPERAERSLSGAPSANRSAASQPAAAAAATPSHACRFEEGQTLSYAISITGSSTLPAAMLGQDPNAAPITLPSTTSLSLDLQALAATSDHATVLLAHYRDVHSSLLDDASTLSSPFLLRVSDACQISGFAHVRGATKAYARTQQSIAHELMWAWPAKDGDELEGENGYGSYLARYTVRASGAHASVKRQIMSYDTFWEEEHGGPQRLEPIPAASEHLIAVDSGPWFLSFAGRERLKGKTTEFDTRIVATRSDAPEHALDEFSHDVSAYEWEDLLPQLFKMRAPRPVTAADLQAREEVRRFKPSVAVERFTKRVKDGVPFERTWPELSTYLEARPETTNAVVALLKTGEVDQQAAPAFYVALGRARTQQSLAALYDIMQSEYAPLPERIRAEFALVDRDDVGVSLARDLAKHADAIDDKSSAIHRVFARESALALGALSGLHEDDTDMQQVVMDTAQSILTKSDDAILVRPAFGALANMGNTRALPIADQAFATGSPEMRAAAAVVVRRMSPNDTNDIVARWLANETDWNVKRAIYSVVSRQMADIALPASPALVAQAVQDLKTDPGNITRKAIVRVLGHSVSVSAQARAALMAQIPLELKKGKSSMYSVIARFLKPEDTREAVAHAM